MGSGNGASAQSATSKTHALAAWVSVYLAEGGQMLVAYLDEVAEAGAFVSKTHKNYNGSPAFGYAGFVIPSDQVRGTSQFFTEKKRRLFAHLIPPDETAGTWERKGSDIFTPVAWDRYRRPIEGFRELVRFVSSRGGRLFFYGEEKPLGTATERWGKDSRVQKQGLLEFKWRCLHQALNRLCTFAESRGEDLIVIMDNENEKERAIQVQNSYAHVFNRTADPDHSEMRRLIESTMHVDSKLSANVQFADWIAAAVRRAFEYQLIDDSPYDWIPTAFEDLMRWKLTIESKLYFSHSRGGVRELHNATIFARERPALAMTISQRLSPEARTRMEAARAGILTVARASGL